LCSSEGLATELRDEIERVIFEQTKPTDRYGADSFEALSELLLRPILRRREQQINTINSSSDKIAEEERLRDQLPKLKKDCDTLDGRIKKSQVELSRLLVKGKEQRAKRLLELEEACTQLEGKIESLNRRQKALDDLFAQVTFILEQSEPERFSEMQSEFSETKLGPSDWEMFRMRFYGDVKQLITSTKKAVETELQKLINGDPKRPVDKAKALCRTGL
jgi:seryl-tRNA synthetase